MTVAPYLDELFSLAGRRAVVTGGSGGIGRGIAEALARAGARVAVIARRPEALAETVAALDRLTGATVDAGAAAFAADVGDRDQLGQAMTDLLATFGAPDILVCSAGINLRPHFDAMTPDVWDRTLAVNLTAPFLLAQRFAQLMAERGYGRIINLASQQALKAFGNSGAYGASKAGVVGLTRSQAEAWAGRGVCVNAISPAFVETEATTAVFADPAVAEAMAARTMVGRNGIVGDLDGLVVFLAGPSSAFLTGQLIYVDGGFSVH